MENKTFSNKIWEEKAESQQSKPLSENDCLSLFKTQYRLSQDSNLGVAYCTWCNSGHLDAIFNFTHGN